VSISMGGYKECGLISAVCLWFQGVVFRHRDVWIPCHELLCNKMTFINWKALVGSFKKNFIHWDVFTFTII
jgi:hypothetical protein